MGHRPEQKQSGRQRATGTKRNPTTDEAGVSNRPPSQEAREQGELPPRGASKSSVRRDRPDERRNRSRPH